MSKRKPINRHVALVLADLYGGDDRSVCPDCIAAVEAWRDDRGTVRVNVEHDDGCPWLAARQARRSG